MANKTIIAVNCVLHGNMNVEATIIGRCWPTKKGKAWIELKTGEVMETNEDYTAFIQRWKDALS